MPDGPGIAGLGQTIAIVDRSGKVMSTSRHLMGVLGDARQAYRERKAQIRAAKQIQAQPQFQAPRRSHTVDNQSVASSRRSHRREDPDSRSRQRRHSVGAAQRNPPRYVSNGPGPGVPRDQRVPDYPPRSQTPPLPTYPSTYAPPHPPPPQVTPFPPVPGAAGLPPTMPARGLDAGERRRSVLPVAPRRSMSGSGIDPDLAYGEIPPNLFEQERENEAELHGLVGRVRGFLDEANCLQYSATQTVQKLQHNPDAMAAVALTLAEISGLVKKMAPGALLSVRQMAPAVFALLCSPQFLVAAGVGVGITIVAFGGYKIVRKIQERNAQENEMEEMMRISSDVSRIESWRRGVAESDAGSQATSVEGEFISPTAARLKALQIRDEYDYRGGAAAATAAQTNKKKTTPSSSTKDKAHRPKSSTHKTKSVHSVRTTGSAASARSSQSSARGGKTRRESSSSPAGASPGSGPAARNGPQSSEAKKGSAKKSVGRSESIKVKPSPLRLMFR